MIMFRLSNTISYAIHIDNYDILVFLAFKKRLKINYQESLERLNQ